jgi:hypothetical protein
MEQTPTHADIMEKIERHENKVESWFIRLIASLVSIFIPIIVGTGIWVWSTHADQLAVNADINARVYGNMQAYQEARANQERIANKLEEIYRFMREDSKEQRQVLFDHIKAHKD